MVKKGCWISLFLVLALALACSDDDDDSDDDSDGSDEDVYALGCDRLALHCLDGDFWENYGIVSAATCLDALQCTRDYYEGDVECQGRVDAVLECAKDMADASGCEACEDLALEIQSYCDYPEPCFE